MAILTDGDGMLIGVDENVDYGAIGPAKVSRAVNLSFTDGSARPRPGTTLLNWLNKPDTVAPQWIRHFTTIHGSGVFRDPNSVPWLLVAADGGVWAMRANQIAQQLALPDDVTIDSECHLEQCYNGVMLFRGAGQSDLILKNINTGFAFVDMEANVVTGATSENPSNGTDAVPNAERGTWIGNRMWIPYDRDLLAISDYLNATLYASVRASARINQGSSDKLIAVIKFTESTVVAFKERSIYALYNAQGDLGSMRNDEITREYGCSAPYSISNVGSEIWFLSYRRGVCRLKQGDGEIYEDPIPVSREMRRTIDRINWQYAANAQAAFHENKYYLAVPLDAAEVVKANIIENATYSGGAYTRSGLVTGRWYRYTPGANDTNLVNGTETLTASGDFQAQATSVVMNGTSSTSVTATVQPLFKGVNNAIMVFDFMTGEWSGYWEGETINVKRFARLPVNGVQRLIQLQNDGYLSTIDGESAVDEVMYPEFKFDFELEVDSAGGVGDTMKLISTTITGGVGATNTSSEWRYNDGDLDEFLSDFWDGDGTGGWNPAAPAPWTAADATVLRNGLKTFRFRRQDGLELVPTSTVHYSGTWTTTNSSSDTSHYASRIERRAIATELISRGYLFGGPMHKRFRECQITLATWAPVFTLKQYTDGQNEAETIGLPERTRSRTKYIRPFDRAPWASSNVNDDQQEPLREDYSFQLAATDEVYIGSGWVLDTEQEQALVERLRGRGRYVRLAVESSGGVVVTRGFALGANWDSNRHGVRA
jgi:hypothetical protein